MLLLASTAHLGYKCVDGWMDMQSLIELQRVYDALLGPIRLAYILGIGLSAVGYPTDDVIQLNRTLRT